MQRTLCINTLEKIEQKVLLKGWVDNRRDHGKLTFIDLRDRSGVVQIVVNPQISKDAHQITKSLGNEDVLSIEGSVQKRTKNSINPNLPTGTIEVQAQKISVIAKAAALPFDLDVTELKVSLPTLLDYRSLTLRHPKVKAIFKIEEVVIDTFRKALRKLGFTEFEAPTIVPSITEGGAEVFLIKYYDYEAFLAQSPQLYKQIMVSIFERVFTVGRAYRAEPSVTTRHITEYITLDAEMGFIDSFEELMNTAEDVILNIFTAVSEKCPNELDLYQANLPKVSRPFPKIKMREAQEIIFQRTGRDNRLEPDLEPEDEREICQWALEEYGSELIFITHYPTQKRPFYTYPDPQNPNYTLSFDLLGRGLEWVTGGQRINNYEQLLENIKKWGNDPKDFEIYLQAFKYGMPPEGGFALGAERIVMKILGLKNIREASLFPRDMERIDVQLSTVQTRQGTTKDLFAKIETLLTKEKIKFKTTEHKPVYTSEQAAKIRGVPLHQGAKALIFKADQKPILIVLPGDRKINTQTFKRLYKIKDLSMPTKEELRKEIGLESGAVPPFGNLLKLPTYFDKSLSDNEFVNFNAGALTKSIEMKYQALENLVQPEIGEFSK